MKHEQATFARAIRVAGALCALGSGACGAQALRDPGSGSKTGDIGHNTVAVGGLEVAREIGEAKRPDVPNGTHSSDMLYRDTTGHPSTLQVVIRKRTTYAAPQRKQAKAPFPSESEEYQSVQPDLQATCPELEAFEGADKLEGGIRLRPAPGVDPAAFMEHVRCHLDHGTLYVPRAQVRAADGGLVDIMDSDPAELQELMRRIEQHIMPFGPDQEEGAPRP